MSTQSLAKHTRDSRLVLAAQTAFYTNRGLTKDIVATWSDTARELLGRQWNVSSECAKLHIDLACPVLTLK